MSIKGTIIAGLVGGLLGGGLPIAAHAGDAQKGKDSKGQNACGGKNGCKGAKGGKTDTGKKS